MERPLREAEPTIPDGELAEDFLSRVRELPSSTLVHIPVCFRSRAAKIMAATLAGMLGGFDRAGILEQARSKVLYGLIPKGFSTRDELGKRFALWENGKFAELLLRAEAHVAFRTQDRTRRRGGSSAQQRAARARTLVKAGAYRRAVVSMTSSVAELSAEEQRKWVEELLPSSTRPDLAHSEPPAPPADSDAGPSAAGKALDGVRFGALSAPGPTGARPEHLQEAIACKPRAAGMKLARAVSALHAAAQDGHLPACARWILDSRLVFLRKKTGNTPRPIRVGELWRRVVAKRMANDAQKESRSFFLRCRQFGISVPGGADVLVHFRSVVEQALQGDDGPALVVFDLDLRNAFPSFEWDSIREAVQEHAPKLSGWSAWCHAGPCQILLPSGEWAQVDRGAEQGDPLGSLYCGLVLAGVMRRVRERLVASAPPGVTPNCFDLWYMDDGQVFLEPALADTFLALLDDELAMVGATRGEGDDVKSVAKLIGSQSAVLEAGVSWISDRIRRTCQLPGANAPSRGILGVDLGDAAVRDAQLHKVNAAVACTRIAIAEIGDAATELILTRLCADVNKVNHLLRANGPYFREETLQEFDDGLTAGLATALAGPLHEEAVIQTSLGVREAGLGARRAVDTRDCAFLASRVRVRPFVLHLAAEFQDEGLLPGGLAEAFDAPVAAAEASIRQGLSPAGVARLDNLLGEWRVRAEEEALALIEDRQAPPVSPRRGARGELGHALVQPAGAEDPEWEEGQTGLQHELCALVDAERGAALERRFADQGRWSDVRRLHELRDPSTSHDWLWSLNPVHGAIIPADEFSMAVRIRIGAHLTEDPALCPRYGCSIVERTAAHALCCASPQGTHGHYEIRDSLLHLTHLADPNASTEVPEIIASAPALRPADIFTSAALPGGMAALDVGVCSPDASGAGADCCEAMWRSKRSHYADYAGEMQACGVTYAPLVISCYGRWHAESATFLDRIAR